MNEWNKNLTFAELRAIRRGTNTVEVYNFPFLDAGRIGIRVLTQDEIFRSTIFWKQEAEKLDSREDVNVVINFTTRELLRKACFVWETDTKFFKSTDEVGELSVDETDALFDLYNRTQEKYAPAQSLETEEEFQELISDIKKKSVRGKSLSSYTLEKLVHFLAVGWLKLQNDNGTISGQSKKNKTNSKKKLATQTPIVEKKIK